MPMIRLIRNATERSSSCFFRCAVRFFFFFSPGSLSCWGDHHSIMLLILIMLLDTVKPSAISNTVALITNNRYQ